MVYHAAKGLAYADCAEGRNFAGSRSRPLDESNQADTSGDSFPQPVRENKKLLDSLTRRRDKPGTVRYEDYNDSLASLSHSHTRTVASAAKGSF